MASAIRSPWCRTPFGHDCKAPGRDAFAWESPVGDQKARNLPIGAGKDKAAFVALREARDASLAMPRLIIPSLQINMRAGHLPPAEDNGKTYLKAGWVKTESENAASRKGSNAFSDVAGSMKTHPAPKCR